MKKAAVDAALLPPIITDKVMNVIWGIKSPHFLFFYQNPFLFHEMGCFVYQEPLRNLCSSCFSSSAKLSFGDMKIEIFIIYFIRASNFKTDTHMFYKKL